MGFVTNDPKKADDKQPGGNGLVMDLDLRACPECRREVPEWKEACPQCGVAAVPQSELPSAMPAVPAHLLADEDDDELPPSAEESPDAER